MPEYRKSTNMLWKFFGLSLKSFGNCLRTLELTFNEKIYSNKPELPDCH